MSLPFKVLMVEDDHPTLSLLAAIARHEGFEAVLADDGEKAMSILMNQAIDAMVLDLLLPRTNGFDILLHCKNSNPLLLSRTIVITAATEQTYRGATSSTTYAASTASRSISSISPPRCTPAGPQRLTTAARAMAAPPPPRAHQ